MGSSESTDKGSEEHEEGKGAEGEQKLSCTPTTGGRRRTHRKQCKCKKCKRSHRKRSHSRRHSRRR